MLRSMYAGISGLENFQTKLDVLGNNIANVNTHGFKKGRTTFKDLVSQQISGASAPTGERGGVNPQQVGLGSQLSSIDTVHTQGSLQTTGRSLDLAISGDGYFQVAEWDDGFVNHSYTRAGNFYLDEEGYLVNADGYYVVGVNDDGNEQRIEIPTDSQGFSIGKDGSVTYIDSESDDEELLETAGYIQLANFANPGGLEKIGDNLYQETPNSGDPQRDVPGAGGSGDLVPSTLEMSNVDLSEEFTEMIVAQRGFQANTRIITTSDEVLQELVNLKR